MTKRVLVPLNPPDWGGLHEIAARIASRSGEAGWHWTVLVPEEARGVEERLLSAGVDVRRIPMSRIRRSVRPGIWLQYARNYDREVRRLADLGRLLGVDVVQNSGVHHFHGVSVAHRLDLPLVWQMHSTAAPKLLRSIVNIEVRRSADVLMTSGSAYLDAHSSLATSRLPIIPFLPPVDTNRFAPNAAVRAQERRRFGIADDEWCIGTVGSQSKVKNHAVLVSAVKTLRAAGVPARLLLVGSPSPSHAAWYRSTVVDAAAALGKSETGSPIVQVVEGEDKVQAFMNAFDIFVLPSLAEGAPLALAEAMSTALPVVSNPVGSIPFMVTDGVDGLLLSDGSIPGLASELSRLYKLPLVTAALAAGGRATALSKFSTAACVARHVEGYELATAGHANR